MSHSLIEPVNLSLPHLPPQLEGLRIGHVSDLHVSQPRSLHRRIISELSIQRLDLLLLTGDFMNRPGDESAAFNFMEELTNKIKPRLGTFGVFGNHDTPVIREQVRVLPVHWLINESHHLAEGALEIFGFDITSGYLTDIAEVFTNRTALARDNGDRAKSRPLRLLLSHMPTLLPTAADIGADMMFSGHTHGGQCRIPTGHPLVNACDLPLRLTSGILRHHDTLALVTRGLGEARLPIRLFCPHQLPVCTLRRGPMLGTHGKGLVNLRWW